VALARGDKEDFRWRNDSLDCRCSWSRTIHVTDFEIQRSFDTALGARKDSCRMPSPFEFFSADCIAAMNAYVNVEQRVDRFVGIGGHHVGSPRLG
jgi:hypothetical protein